MRRYMRSTFLGGTRPKVNDLSFLEWYASQQVHFSLLLSQYNWLTMQGRSKPLDVIRFYHLFQTYDNAHMLVEWIKRLRNKQVKRRMKVAMMIYFREIDIESFFPRDRPPSLGEIRDCLGIKSNRDGLYFRSHIHIQSSIDYIESF